MKRCAIMLLFCVPLVLLLAMGFVLSGIECGAGWLNDRCQKWFEDIYRGGSAK